MSEKKDNLRVIEVSKKNFRVYRKKDLVYAMGKWILANDETDSLGEGMTAHEAFQVAAERLEIQLQNLSNVAAVLFKSN